MYLALVIMELVRPIKRLVAYAVTTVDKTGVLRSTMLFAVAPKVTGTSEGFGTIWMITFKATDIDIGTCRCGSNAADRNRQLSEVCCSQLVIGACRTLRLRLGDGRVNRTGEVVAATKFRKMEGTVKLLKSGNI